MKELKWEGKKKRGWKRRSERALPWVSEKRVREKGLERDG